MRLARAGEPGNERPIGIVSMGQFVELSDVIDDYDEAFFDSGELDHLAPIIADRQSAGEVRELGSVRIAAPIARPHQIICVGLNYVDHAAESEMIVPTEPILFSKSPNTMIGPNDDIQIPRNSTKTDWEVELGLVIGRRARNLESEREALDHIAGYLIVNDVSEREFQLERGGQWLKGKSAPTFNPAGPFLATPDEIADPLNLALWLEVDGIRRQTGNTRDMIFSPAFIVHYVSQFLTLEPGDLINTGTPPGVGMGYSPPVYLRGGEILTAGIDQLGVQKQRVLPAK